MREERQGVRERVEGVNPGTKRRDLNESENVKDRRKKIQTQTD